MTSELGTFARLLNMNPLVLKSAWNEGSSPHEGRVIFFGQKIKCSESRDPHMAHTVALKLDEGEGTEINPVASGGKHSAVYDTKSLEINGLNFELSKLSGFVTKKIGCRSNDIGGYKKYERKNFLKKWVNHNPDPYSWLFE